MSTASSTTSNGTAKVTSTLTLGRPRSRLATPLLVILVPALIASIVSYPFFIIFSFYDPPPAVTLPYLPYHPYKCLKIILTFSQIIKDFISSNYLSLYFDSQLKKLSSLSSKQDKQIPNFIVKDLDYRELKNKAHKLDIYKPSDSTSSAPVIVLCGGANWTLYDKSHAYPIGMRLRRLGYCVVVPNWSQAPGNKTSEMVSDLRYALEWTESHVKEYGGDPDALFVLGYGSGAHLATLTVVQDAVVRSRDDYLNQITSTPLKQTEPEEIEVSAGIKRCTIWGEQARLPPIQGVILVAGVFDVIKQLRYEAKLGIEDISALRRVCGPSTGASLLSCPSHLLYGAKEILDPSRLPPKFLIVAGGKDTAVPYTQSVLLRSLLVGVGVPEVRLKLYRELSHIGSLTSLMHQTRYSPLFLSEIEALVSSDAY